MAKLWWHQIDVAEPERSYTALLGVVQLQSILLLPTFIYYGVRIENQLKRSPGVVGYRVRAEFAQMRFLHLSVWTDHAAIRSFIHERPHERAMKTLYGRLGRTEFRYWEISGSEVPLSFESELERLK